MVTFEFNFDDSFVAGMFARYRRTNTLTHVRQVLRVLIAAFLLATIIPAVVLTGDAWWLACLLFLPLLLLRQRIETFLVLRNFRKSPYHNEHARIALGDDGYQVHTETTDSRSSWETCTEVCHLDDGLILLHGPQVFHWLPFASLVEGSREQAEQILRTKVEKHRSIR